MKELIERLRSTIKNHIGLDGSFVRTRLTKPELEQLLDAAARDSKSQVELKRLQQKLWDQSSRQMKWYKKHGYCHTGSHTLESCPGDHGK